ncbi:MAG: 50S ribosomal protein L6 [Planctomycetota bacterium]|nr:50S ribosomal protein L6 [Planctomycetota bacterium]MCX8040824.1 50S ribosomal protein L6 [Planctomycetota bacterium]MDW8372275.1 50S ribosomal protein L6 [Planctomycetota bacterium]
MSRIGKQPVAIPQGVQVALEGRTLKCKGPKGTNALTLCDGIRVRIDNGQLHVERERDDKHTRAMHGTTRALVRNLVEGVSKGYSKSLEIVGVGYRAALKGRTVVLNVGFANAIEIPIPEGITVTVPDQTHITVSGIDKALVGQVAANIRAARKPEPYKGKGIRYANEVVRRKAGKAAATGGAKK